MNKIIAVLLVLTMFGSLGVAAEENAEVTSVKVTTTSAEVTTTSAEVTTTEAEVTTTSEEVTVDEVMDGGLIPVLDNSQRNETFSEMEVIVDGEALIYDVQPVIKDGVVTLPLRLTLEALGYEIVWNEETWSVDIIKGAQFTSIKIGENSYFKNRMAAMELSVAPFIEKDRTMVPLEFFYVILDLGFTVESNNVVFNSESMGVHSGYVKEISYDETGMMSITLSSIEPGQEVDEDVFENLVILHTNSNFTVFQREVEVGDYITGLGAPVMIMTYPGETGVYIIY